MRRRRFLASGLAALAAGHWRGALSATVAPHGRLRVIALGQALIEHDLRRHAYPDLDAFAARFAGADITFTDLEIAIKGPRAGAPTRGASQFTHAAAPAVLDCLKDLSVNVLAMSNNHAFDLGSGGILDAIDQVRARGLTHAGTGRNLAEAVAPASRETSGGRFSLVSFATGMIRSGGAATPERPGVNEIRRDAPGVLNEEDVERNLASVRAAAAASDVVMVYHHNHYWEPDFADTPAWQKALARRCIDNGATVFVSHGAPLLHGIEIYRDRPIFYGLGSFVFHTVTPVGYYRPEVWESAIADCVFAGGRLDSMQLLPVVLNERGISPELHLETRGRPAHASGEEASRILARLSRLSAALGTRIGVQDGMGRIV